GRVAGRAGGILRGGAGSGEAVPVAKGSDSFALCEYVKTERSDRFRLRPLADESTFPHHQPYGDRGEPVGRVPRRVPNERVTVPAPSSRPGYDRPRHGDRVRTARVPGATQCAPGALVTVASEFAPRPSHRKSSHET